jgi:iron complex transport system substrate-binding protein
VPDGRVAGVDSSEAMLAMASRRNRAALAAGRVDLRLGRAEEIPFADASFDAAYAANSVQFWPGPERSMLEVRRVLRPGGTLLLAIRLDEPGAGRFASPGFSAAQVDEPALRVFYQVSDVPLFTLGGQHLVNEAISQCGGRNVFAALALPAPQVSVEAVLAADPQVIVAGTDGAERPAWLERWRQWTGIDAVRRNALYAVDANLLHRPGPRFIDGIAQLCDVLSMARRSAR